MPEPRCASCHSDFVETIENTEDDPRAFQRDGPPFHDHEHGGFAGNEGPMGPDQALEMFQLIVEGLGGAQRRTIRIDRRSAPGVPDSTGDFRSASAPNSFGGAAPGGQGFVFTSTGGGGLDGLPEMHTIYHPYPAGGAPNGTPGPAGRPGFLHQLLLGMFGAPLDIHGGQFGDYALNNEAVPAPDDLIARLPRTKLVANSM
ncbi:hypothetical protein BS47DRAFT_1350807 [Hydnum rufescens UP504]|uniref:Uncharacterized protein n=1 Tax=Hydnum rufescens UP504 TaxID=1448309 RepID=A0A9P6ALD1_9AGAM|nr:hypothetical protein BS47DRAFT_1350807 [Hydnum rufescens UP504]